MENKFSLENLYELMEKLDKSSLSKIRIKEGDWELELCKEVKELSFSPPPMPMTINAAVSSGVNPPADSADESSSYGGNVVKSPIVGTFYATPSPEKPPFVKLGQQVKKGDILFIVESMKLMNEVKSEFDGVVERILAENGQPLEFGQPVMIVS